MYNVIVHLYLKLFSILVEREERRF